MSQQKSIIEMARGGAMERIDYEMPKILANILDPNTKAVAKRKLTITVEFLPNDDRTNIGVHFTVKPTLAATNPVTTTLYVSGQEGTGEAQVVELPPQIPGQMGLDGSQQEMPPILKLFA